MEINRTKCKGSADLFSAWQTPEDLARREWDVEEESDIRASVSSCDIHGGNKELEIMKPNNIRFMHVQRDFRCVQLVDELVRAPEQRIVRFLCGCIHREDVMK